MAGVRQRRDLGRRALLFILSLLLVLAIALAQRWGWLRPFNHGLMGGAGAWRDTAIGPPVTLTMVGLSEIGDTAARIGMSLVACAMLFWRGRGRQTVWLVLVVVGGTLLNAGLKQVFAAPRPDLLPHLDIVKSYSFPSGHASGNMIFFGALAMLIGRGWAWTAASAMILAIGFSRVWLGVHWPTDVLAGWILGMGWLFLCGGWLRR
ncbi:phosphatase PAP2 family protein [Sphingobium phenoxybenzoativorans]|uniref:phosphatase PAP2 family protein n=1 Tax=Sphingobium phenoxybenzoativorans TaxID=1592790 RepID=UPI000871B727